jgi:hypothetical protein
VNSCICFGLGQSPSSVAEAVPQINFDLRPVHQPPGIWVEFVAAVHDAAVVPQYEVADPPLLVPGQLGAGGVRPQRIEQLLALFECETLNIGVTPTPEKNRFATGNRMGADDRMVSAGGLPRIAHLDKPASQLAGAVAARVVSAKTAFDPTPQLLGQSLVSQVHIGKAGVATRGRYFEGIKCAGAGRFRIVRHVGVPDRLVSTQRTDRLAVLDDIGNDRDVLAPLLRRVDIAVFATDFDARGGDDRRPVELAEMRAEPHQLVVVEKLAAETQHEVIGPRLFDRADDLRG